MSPIFSHSVLVINSQKIISSILKQNKHLYLNQINKLDLKFWKATTAQINKNTIWNCKIKIKSSLLNPVNFNFEPSGKFTTLNLNLYLNNKT